MDTDAANTAGARARRHGMIRLNRAIRIPRWYRRWMGLSALGLLFFSFVGLPAVGSIRSLWPTDLPPMAVALPQVPAPTSRNLDVLFGRQDVGADATAARTMLRQAVFGISIPYGSRMAIGTGVLHRGRIFTNYHVIDGALDEADVQDRTIYLIDLDSGRRVAFLTVAALPRGAAGGTSRDVAVLDITPLSAEWKWLSAAAGLDFAPNPSPAMLGVYASFAAGGTSGSPLIDLEGRIVALTSEGGDLRGTTLAESSAIDATAEQQLLSAPAVAVRRAVVPQTLADLAPFIETRGPPIDTTQPHLVVNYGWPAGVPAWSYDILMATHDDRPTTRSMFLEPWARAMRRSLGLRETLTPDVIAQRSAATTDLLSRMSVE